MANLKAPTEEQVQGFDPKVINNTQYILKDLIQGDNSVFDGIENLDMNTIKKALDFLLKNDGLEDFQKLELVQDSWRVNFLEKPPTPEEFLGTKYLGPTSDTLYPYVKDTIIKFMDPTSPYRNLILYPFIGWGKDQPLDSKVYLDKNNFKLMKDISVGDEILSPDGSKTKVIATVNWPEDEVYELEMDNGKKMRCGPHHLHHVSYRKDRNGNKIWDAVETVFLIEHPELDFEFEEVMLN